MLKLLVYFGDWNVGEVERWLPNETDDSGLTYKKMLIRPDEQTILAMWGSREEFEKFAVDRKLRASVGGDYIVVKLWDQYFLPIFQYGDQNILFVMCGFNGEETVFTRVYSDLLMKIQNRDSDIESLRAQVALQGQKINDLVKRKFHETETMKELAESISMIGSSRRAAAMPSQEELEEQGVERPL